VDLEQISAGFATEEIAQQFFAAAEVRELAALPAEQRLEGFYLCWTRKEAFIKARGEGLSLPLSDFVVSLTPGEPAELRSTWPDAGEAARWDLRNLEVGPGYAAALCVAGAVRLLRMEDWPRTSTIWVNR
jgi:4'-phosphopantetheinyl transferase